MYWVYKCNAQNHPYQVAYGDWNDFFVANTSAEWGSTEWVPALARARRNDTILAYQTDRNELVGLARVVRLKPRGRFQDLILEPLKKIGVQYGPSRPSLRSFRRSRPSSNPVPSARSIGSKQRTCADCFGLPMFSTVWSAARRRPRRTPF